MIDSALRVKYAPTNVKQLLVITTSHKLLKFDSRNGKILAEVSESSNIPVSLSNKPLYLPNNVIIF